MNPKKPQNLLEELSKDDPNGHALRDRLKANKDSAKAALAEYGVSVTDELLTPERDPPPREKIDKALKYLQQQGQHSQKDWETYALLVVVIGAIPFVAADAR